MPVPTSRRSLLALVAVGAAALASCSVERGDRLEVDRTDPGPLIDAAERGDLARVRELLDAGVDVDRARSDGVTALVAAAYPGRVEVARLLLERGADPNHEDSSEQSAFLIATSEVGDDPRLLDLTFAHGADVAAKDSFNGTGLIRAAHRGYPRVCARLIEEGVEVDHVNELGWTALLEAVILGDGDVPHQEVVRLIVAAGADRSVRDPSGRTALDHAREKGQREIIALLEG